MNLRELGLQIRHRREVLGLSQQRLARLAGLSRATISQLETGASRDLGITKLAALMDLVGLRLDASLRARTQQALLMASRTASVSFKTPMQADQLAHALATGDLPVALMPHLVTLLDEVPLSLIVSAVEQAAERSQVPPKRIWQHVLRWAAQLHSPRHAWA